MKIVLSTWVKPCILGDLLERDDSPTVQRAAANDVLGHVMKFMELKELEDRLADIERHIGRQQ